MEVKTRIIRCTACEALNIINVVLEVAILDRPLFTQHYLGLTSMQNRYYNISIILLTGLFVFGCEEDLNLRADHPEPFTLYGVISPDLDTQAVRVYPIENFSQLALNLPHGITFTSTDLDTGERIIWQDTILTQPSGQQDLAFWSPFRAEFGHRYRVEARRASDGAASFAETHIPAPVTVRITELGSPSISEVFLRITVAGEGFRALKPEIAYRIRYTALPHLIYTYRLSHQGTEFPVEEGWAFDFNFYLDRYNVQGMYNVDLLKRGILPNCIRCSIIDLLDMDLHLVVGNADWDPPFGRFDANLLSHQDALTNVENGLGFVGGGYRIAEDLRPSRKAVEDACFTYIW